MSSSSAQSLESATWSPSNSCLYDSLNARISSLITGFVIVCPMFSRSANFSSETILWPYTFLYSLVRYSF